MTKKVILKFFPKKSKFFVNLPGKIEIFRQFAWKNRNFSSISVENRKFLSIWILISLGNNDFKYCGSYGSCQRSMNFLEFRLVWLGDGKK